MQQFRQDADQLPFGEPVALRLGRQHRGQQVVARLLRPALRHQVMQVLAEPDHRGGLFPGEGLARRLVDVLEQHAHPLTHALMVLVRDAEQLAQHPDGERISELRQEVHLPRPGAPGEHVAAHAVDARRPTGDPARQERPVDDAPQPPMAGPVQADQAGGVLVGCVPLGQGTGSQGGLPSAEPVVL